MLNPSYLNEMFFSYGIVRAVGSVVLLQAFLYDTGS